MHCNKLTRISLYLLQQIIRKHLHRFFIIWYILSNAAKGDSGFRVKKQPFLRNTIEISSQCTPKCAHEPNSPQILKKPSVKLAGHCLSGRTLRNTVNFNKNSKSNKIQETLAVVSARIPMLSDNESLY